MRLYSLYNGCNWVADGMSVEEIANVIGCSTKRVLTIIGNGLEEKGYGVVFDGDYSLTKYGKIDKKLLAEFDCVTSRIRELVSA